MKRALRAVSSLLTLAIIASGLVLLLPPPRSPVAILRVMDPAGNPLSGAVITPDYLVPTTVHVPHPWREAPTNAKPEPVVTADDGVARLPYPFHAEGRLETGEIAFAVDHPDHVHAELNVTVATSAPPDAQVWEKLQFWATRFWVRIRDVDAPATTVIKLDRGAVVEVSGFLESSGSPPITVRPQIRGFPHGEGSSWTEVRPGVLTCRRIKAGRHWLRLTHAAAGGRFYFSEVQRLDARSGETNRFELPLRVGTRVIGRLEDSATRPIRNGRVLARVWPNEIPHGKSPPTWRAWCPIGGDGTFEFDSLPPGQLEFVAICDGFIGAAEPGGPSSWCVAPQRAALDQPVVEIAVGMQPTARFEVVVLDDESRALAKATVGFMEPRILWSDPSERGWHLSSTAEFLHPNPQAVETGSRMAGIELTAGSDSNGLAVLPNLPGIRLAFTVEHDRYEIPAQKDANHRFLQIDLDPGRTNRMAIKLQRKALTSVQY